MNDNRTGTVRYETPDGPVAVEGAINIEESQTITAVRVRSADYEQVIPWERVIRIEY